MFSTLNDFTSFNIFFTTITNKYYNEGNTKKFHFMKTTIEYLRLILVNFNKLSRRDILMVINPILTEKELELCDSNIHLLFLHQSSKLLISHIINDIKTIPITKISYYIENNIYTPWDLKYTLLYTSKYSNLVFIAKNIINPENIILEDIKNENLKNENLKDEDIKNENLKDEDIKNENVKDSNKILLPINIKINNIDYTFNFTKEFTIGLLVSSKLTKISPFVLELNPILKKKRYKNILENCSDDNNFTIKLFDMKFKFFDKIKLHDNFQNSFSDTIKYYVNPYITTDKLKVLMFGVNISNINYSFYTKDFFEGFINGAKWRDLDPKLYYKDLVQYFEINNDSILRIDTHITLDF
jgi:hypothetical protein